MAIFEKYVNRTDFTSYEDFKENFRICVPEKFNFAYDVLDQLAKDKPEEQALVWCNEENDEKIFTFADMKRYSDKAANLLKNMGIKKGDSVMLVLKRHYQFWYVIMALHKIGAVAVPATHLLTAKDIVYRCNRADVKAVICTTDHDFPKQVDLAQKDSPTLKLKFYTNGSKKQKEAEQAKINAETAQIKDAMPSVEQQKKEGQKQIEYYENIGCGENENLNSCQKRYDAAHTSSGSSSIGGAGNIMPPSASGFYRPMVSGYVTQNWMNAGHLGIDLSNTNKTIEIYPIATGVVFAKYYDDYGALVLKIRHYVNGSYIYSTYAHLSAWYVNVGDIVTPDTVIGRMGNTGYSFGAHLHLELTTCDWHAGGGCTWSTYQRSTINPRQYIGLPSGLRVWWNGR